MIRALLLVTALLVAVPAAAEPGRLLTFAGSLTNAAGAPVDASVAMTFRLYDASAGGSALWNEPQSVPVTAGRFTVVLGTTSELTPTVLLPAEGAPEARYLAIEIEGAELEPRIRIGSAAFAVHADIVRDADTLGGLAPAAFAPTRHEHGDRYITKVEADGRYARSGHSHGATYALDGHRHDALYAPLTHSHDERYSAIGHLHDEQYSLVDHSHEEYALAAHDHASAYYDRATATARYAGAAHDHDADYFPRAAADTAFLTPAAGDLRYLGRTDAATRYQSVDDAYDRATADARYVHADGTSFLTRASADPRFVPRAGIDGDFSTGGNLEIAGPGGIVFGNGTRLTGAAVAGLEGGSADGLHHHNYLPDAWCPGVLMNGVCVAGWRSLNDTTFLNAATACANLGADIATDSQMMMLNYANFGDIGAYWSSSFGDNDGAAWNHLFNTGADDRNQTNGYAYICVYNITPPEVPSQLVGGVRVTYVHNVDDTPFDLATRICTAKQSDLCSDTEYGILRAAGHVSGRMWSSSKSDADGAAGIFSAFQGEVSDNNSYTARYGFACCASRRPLNRTCPGGTRIASIGTSETSGVCVLKMETAQPKSLLPAARDCAEVGGRLCTTSQSAVLRSAGVFTPNANWTLSHADNDGGDGTTCSTKNGPNIGVGCSMPDNPSPTSAYAYACCL